MRIAIHLAWQAFKTEMSNIKGFESFTLKTFDITTLILRRIKMKKRKLSKNLFLNKTTIANLGNLNDIKGGTGRCNTGLTPPGGTYCLACPEPPDDPVDPPNTAMCVTEDPQGTCVPCTFPTLCC